MRSKVNFNLNEINEKNLQDFFDYYSGSANGAAFIQDTIHILTKLRNRILKPSIMLPMGNYQISVTHIKILLSLVAKEEHGLVISDICPEDRQNFASCQKIMHSRVLSSLEKHVFESDATVMYLKICGKVASSFLETSLSATERIFRIWYCVYFLRGWRKWLQRSEYKISDHFISPNSYACIEINAHGLIYIVQLLQNNSHAKMFLPQLMASQPCENIFRQMRSMSTANFTKINFNLFELLHLVSRVELMNDIIYSRMKVHDDQAQDASSFISFLKIKKILEMEETADLAADSLDLPSNKDIVYVMKRAQSDAIKDAIKLGIKMEVSDVVACPLLESKIANMESEIDEELDEEIANETAFEFEAEIEGISDDTHSKYIDVQYEDGTTKTIRKSTLLWMLCESKEKLSSDRLKRVQEAKGETPKRRKLDPVAATSSSATYSSEIRLIRSSEIEIGDWCFFMQSGFPVEQLSEQNILDNVFIGRIVSFNLTTRVITDENKHTYGQTSNQIAHGRKSKTKNYLIDFAPISKAKKNENTNIQALSTWYICSTGGEFQPAQNKNHFFLDIENYIATFENISINMSVKEFDSRKCLSIAHNLTEIKSLLYKYILEHVNLNKT